MSLEVQPASIVVPSSTFTVQARVALRNPGTETLKRVSLSYFSNDGIKAEIGQPCSKRAGPKHQIVWPVIVVGQGDAHLPGSLTFEARYFSESGTHHVYVPVTLQTDAQKPLDISLEGNLDAVSQQRAASTYLVVTNNMDVSVEITVTPQVPIKEIIVPPVPSFSVPARSTVPTKIDVQTATRVTPGVYPIPLQIDARWAWAGRDLKRRFVLSKSATIGVFFESELLKALGVPSFLVLAGCLMVFAFQFLLSFNVLGLKDYSRIPELGLTSPGFWILSVSLSAMFAYTYYLWTGINYLVSYGLDDLKNVWLSSIPLGFAVYLFIAIVTLRWRNSHIPSSSDKPIAILKKLSNIDLGISLVRVTHRLGNQDFSGYLLEKIEDGKPMVWIAPPILVRWQAGAAAAVRDGFDTELNGNRRPAELARILEQAGNTVTVEWSANGTVPIPYHAKTDTITQYQAAQVIVNVV